MVHAHLDIFIIGFFEDADYDTSTNAVNELFQWWNMYVLYPSMLEY